MRTGNIVCIFVRAPIHVYICTCVYSSQSFSLFARLFVLENYNFGRAIAITPAGTSAYIHIYIRTGRSDQTCILLVSCSYAWTWHGIFIPQYVCQLMQRWHSAIGIFSVVTQRDYLLTEKYCAARRGQLIADLILLQRPSL